MRFGLFVPQGWRLDLAGIDVAEHWATMQDIARAADDGPFESIWVFDHFHTVPVPTQEATHEAWTLMAAFAAATSRVRLGQMCTCIGYRNPAYLAKVAATVDVISGGREKKTLRIAAQYATYTNYDPTPEVFRRKSQILAGHCRELGTDFDAITRSANYNVILGETDRDVQDRIAWMKDHLIRYGTPEDIAQARVRNFAEGPLVGTPELVAERLAQAGELGMSYAIVNFAEVAYDRTALNLFTEKVVPALASAGK
jgi:alkanesulfonate monooxygenase SsuD/methylene tetrahydromethanopterin reductase-like flavin-dependent oxidoreductase (luciferase family)